MSGRFEIPDYDQLEDESFPPLPPPVSPGQGGDDLDPFANGEQDGELSKLEDVPAAKRRMVRRPQPKLDSQRLISERGLPALRTLFSSANFKGKGHEAEDLRVIMQKMENWAHRLYPKLSFDDFMVKVEKLGSKKDVQTCLKRIRLDMPLIHNDFISNDGEEEMTPAQHVFEDPDPFGSSRVFPGDSQGPVHSTPAPIHSTPAPTTTAPTLTEEQQRRIELNKQLALERRLARKQQHTGEENKIDVSWIDLCSGDFSILDLPDSQAVSSQAHSAQADSAQAVSPQADSAQADSSQADSAQADSSQADSSQAVSPQADSAQADSPQADSAQAVSPQSDSAQAVSPQADSAQAVSPQADSAQAVSPQAVSSQASPVHQPPASSPPSEPCPPEREDTDLDVGPSTEHPDNTIAKHSPVSLASPQREEGEPSQPPTSSGATGLHVHQSQLPHLLQEGVEVRPFGLAEGPLLPGEPVALCRLLLRLLGGLLGQAHHLLHQLGAPPVLRARQVRGLQRTLVWRVAQHLQTVLMWSGYLWTEPLCHSQVPSCPALTTWPSRFFTYTAPFRPYLPTTPQSARPEAVGADGVHDGVGYAAGVCQGVFVLEVETLEQLCGELLGALRCLRAHGKEGLAGARALVQADGCREEAVDHHVGIATDR
ncbi:TIMELESS-interacting protein [Merluccius polli]|uniref:TIMELESS-interacting protein n=1 Tax=Merluccius polli TaxID=89951 RepID=A0AA47MHA8_MERPO|nr:TIMELESS-interacting protein [Merluccius polli]